MTLEKYMTIPHILNAMQDKNILVIGDLMLDHYIWGDVHRISPEAPVPVVNASHESHTAGGAANVALNLASLGVSVRLAGALGEDAAGDRLLGLLRDAGVDTSLCLTKSRRPTIVKTRVIVRNQQLCRIDHEAAASLYSLDPTAALLSAIKASDAIIVSDYAKGVISQSTLNSILDHAKQHGKTIAIDPKPSRKMKFKGASLITPNRHEALELAGIAEPAIDEPYPLNEICRIIHERHAPKLLIITLGADGMAISRNGKVELTLPTQAREVFDVSGAGDTVIATLTAALASGAAAEEAAKLANLAAGVVVSRIGTSTVCPRDLIDPL
jgi:D-beta-D-heptose 7-phosphate kinase/D-beta-D-heptose 1-phosphate adenosyltransferase